MNPPLVKKAAFIGIMLISLNIYAAANFKNGDFESGKGRWKGDGKIIQEGEKKNKVLKLEAGKKEQTMELQFDVPKGATRAKFEYQVKAENFKTKHEGEKGFTLVWVNKGHWISGHGPAKQGEWVTIKATFKVKPDTKFAGVRFRVDPGSGILYFDNLTLLFE